MKWIIKKQLHKRVKVLEKIAYGIYFLVQGRKRLKKALNTDVTGQSGSYLAEFSLDTGYEVNKMKQSAYLVYTQRVDHIYEDNHVLNSHFAIKLRQLR